MKTFSLNNAFLKCFGKFFFFFPRSTPSRNRISSRSRSTSSTSSTTTSSSSGVHLAPADVGCFAWEHHPLLGLLELLVMCTVL